MSESRPRLRWVEPPRLPGVAELLLRLDLATDDAVLLACTWAAAGAKPACCTRSDCALGQPAVRSRRGPIAHHTRPSRRPHLETP